MTWIAIYIPAAVLLSPRSFSFVRVSSYVTSTIANIKVAVALRLCEKEISRLDQEMPFAATGSAVRGWLYVYIIESSELLGAGRRERHQEELAGPAVTRAKSPEL